MTSYNSTIISKKKRCKSCGILTILFSRGRCQQCAKIEDTEKRLAEFEDKEEVESLQNLIQDLDAIFSTWVRTREANDKGMVTCYTCGKELHYTQMQNSHFIPRRHLASRFLPANCKPACQECNEFKSGNLDAYEAHLNKENPGTVEYLRELSQTVCKPTINELKSLIIEYRHKNELIKRKFK